MRAGLGVVAMLAGGCSFLGGHVSNTPPPPDDCPSTVVILDMSVAALMTVPLGLGILGAAVSTSPSGPRTGDLVRYFVPIGLIEVTYLVSGFYGLSQRNKCLRMKRASAEPAPAAAP